MKKLAIATDLHLPLDVVTSTIVVYGGKGMGKTNLGSVMMEELAAASLRFAVLDPMGVWWGLRHSEDGKGPGIKVLILGGTHGDIPIEPTAGIVVADLVVDEDVSVVIDISRRPDGTMWSIGERVRFVTDYCKRLYQRQGEQRHPVMQVIDEAARFIPQTIRKGDEQVAACMGAIAVLVEEGRNVAIGVMLITQRSARLNKDVAELADVMIAFRTVGPNSRRAVLDWLGEHVEKDRLQELDKQVRSLPIGSALVVSPGWLEFEGVVRFRARQTFDSSATPKPGQAAKKVRGAGAMPDLAKYQTRMVETIERAKADDKKELKKRIAELEKELKLAVAGDRQSYPTAHAYEKACEALKKTKEQNVALVAANREIAARLDRLGKMFARAFKINEEIAGELLKDAPKLPDLSNVGTMLVKLPPIPQAATKSVTDLRPTREPRPAVSTRPMDGDDPIKPVHLRILNALAELEALGAAAPERILVAFMSGYSHVNSTGFAKAVSQLKTQNLIDYTTSGGVVITSDGKSLASPVDEPTTTKEVQSRIVSLLKPVHGRVLQPVIDIYPGRMTRDELARQSGYSHVNSTGFAKAVSHLSSLGFLTYPTKGEVAAAPVLFMEGR